MRGFFMYMHYGTLFSRNFAARSRIPSMLRCGGFNLTPVFGSPFH